MNSREEILNCANIEYRSIFISGADAEGFGTRGFNNYNCLINYNILKVIKEVMKHLLQVTH